MAKSFRLSLYLLLIIPPNENSPVPRAESWMEMDREDGFVDSSLTGAESFGSAHKKYQNALILKRKSESEDKLMDKESGEKFSGSTGARSQRKTQMSTDSDKCSNRGFSKPENCEHIRDANGYEDRYRMKLKSKRNQNDGSSFSKHSDKLRNERYTDQLPARYILSPKRNARDFEKNPMDSFVRGARRMEMCSACKNQENRQEGGSEVEQPSAEDQSEYSNDGDLGLNRAKNELSEEQMKDLRLSQLEPSEEEEQHEDEGNYDRNENEKNGLEDGDYYVEDKNPCPLRRDTNSDYNLIDSHGLIFKREENNRGAPKTKTEEESEEAPSETEKSKSMKSSRSDSCQSENSQENQKTEKSDPALDMVWKLHDNLQSKELHKVMRESQRALEEVQQFQQKLPNKPESNSLGGDWKGNSYIEGKKLPEGKRNKREDEDEQKNMKTGTDEGGSEYEYEEGKGHNDDEEYYEDTNLKSRKCRKTFGQMQKSSNKKLQKRQIRRDLRRRAFKQREAPKDISSPDYELNLKNAPVEKEDKRSPFFWNGVVEKNIGRKGAKIWDEWGRWSPCSVTCGIGRMTRWRHCIGGGCAQGEKEAQIKKCTNPAC